MSEWKEVRLGDVCNLYSGGTPNKNNKTYWNGNIPWISAKSMYGDYIEDADLYITEEGLSNGSRLAPKGSILILTRGSGLYNRIPICYTLKDVAFNQDVKRIESKDEDLYPNDLLYYILYANKKTISSIIESTGIGAGKIDTDRFLNLPITIPPVYIQKDLMELFNAIFSKIETNNKLNEKLEEMAQAIFKSWFVDFEPFKDKPFHETELGMIPEGWEVGSLSDIATITMGQSPCGTSYNENGEGIIFYQGRTEFGFRFPSIRLYTTAPSRFAEVGSTLMSVRAPVGDINMALLRCCIGRGVASIKSNCDCDSYIYYLMKSLKKRFDIYNGEGTVFGSVGRDTLRGMLITIPPSSVISDFEMNISKIDSRIKTNELESQRLASLRDTLLPRLMSGELIV